MPGFQGFEEGGHGGNGTNGADGAARFVSEAEKLEESLEMNTKLEEELKVVVAERDAATEATAAAEAERDAADVARQTAEKLSKDLQSELDIVKDELDALRRRVKRSVSIFLPQDKVPAAEEDDKQ